jgi:hypothetical protein
MIRRALTWRWSTGYSGVIAGIPSYQQGKVARLAQWREAHPQHVVLPIPAAACLHAAMRGGPVAAQAAGAAGWPVLRPAERILPGHGQPDMAAACRAAPWGRARRCALGTGLGRVRRSRHPA